MTVTIVSVFALCWLPYATMAMWYMIDRVSARRVSPRVQDLLFAMAVSNSCMNPLVYGSYTLNLRAMWKRFLRSWCASTRQSDTLGNSGSSSIKNRNNNMETPLMAPTKVITINIQGVTERVLQAERRSRYS
ncbi:7 transmembrane receptor (rhodopsin family) domain-containing protein [Phthorimaea operculella]|nr:7 transmembrane receptor (rhodopsin family) domain-containing protein [Phthorimaea operculella]